MSKVASLNVPSDIVAADRKPTDWSSEAMRSRVRRRYRSERIFRTTGFLAVSLSVLFLAFLLSDMLSKGASGFQRSEEHTSELRSLMRISYAVFCLKKKKNQQPKQTPLVNISKHQLATSYT